MHHFTHLIKLCKFVLFLDIMKFICAEILYSSIGNFVYKANRTLKKSRIWPCSWFYGLQRPLDTCRPSLYWCIQLIGDEKSSWSHVGEGSNLSRWHLEVEIHEAPSVLVVLASNHLYFLQVGQKRNQSNPYQSMVGRVELKFWSSLKPIKGQHGK